MALQLRSLLDIPRIQSLVNLFHQVTGIPVAMADDCGTTLLASWQPNLCLDFFKTHDRAGVACRESNQRARELLKNEEVGLFRCSNGLSSLTGRIMIDGEIAGILFVGPFFVEGEQPSESAARRMAAELGFEEETFLKNVRDVAVLGQDQIQRAQAFIKGLAGFLAEIGMNFRRKEMVEEERQHLALRVAEAQKMESLGLLARGIAHDFNNLLMGVLGHAGLARELLLPQSTARSHLEQIETTAQRMADLTRQLLAYAGCAPFSRGRVDINELVLEMKDLLRFSISKKTTLRLHLSGEPLPIDGDATQLRQVVMNLISNAAEALGEDEGLITVGSRREELSLEAFEDVPWHDQMKAGQYVVLEVSDTGCGISPEALSRVFDPFFSTKFIGRGLGLSALQGMVRAHQGAARVSSTPGQGTKVSVFLPLAEKFLEKEIEEALLLSSENRPYHQDGKTVLVVDDEDLVRSVTGAMLRGMGYEVLQAKDGEEGLDVFRKGRGKIQAVLLDMAMPRKTGVEVFHEIHRLNPDIPVVLMSGYNEQETAKKFSTAQPAAILTKPFRPEDLRKKFDELGLLS